MLNDAGLRAFLAGLEGAIDQGTQETAEQVKATRDPLTPVDTGELLGSGKVVQVAPGHYQVREGDGLPDARAVYTEYGTSRQAAQPHMTPAAEQHRADLPKNIAAKLKELEGRSRV
jgi:hypothetical protein